MFKGSNGTRRAVHSHEVTRAEIEAVLLELWSELLGSESLDVDDDFFAHGGDSMGATWMFAEVEVRLDIERPVSLLLEAPTIRELAQRLATPVTEDDVLVPIHTEGDRPPLVAIHGGYGGILWAGPLVEHLGLDQPLFGIRPPGFDRLASMRSIEDLAADYLALVEAEIGSATPMLFGYSYGGTVAFEMALQLQAAGRPVGLVAIGDMPVVELSAHGRRVDPLVRRRRSTLTGLVRSLVARPYILARQRLYRMRRAPWEQRVLRRSSRMTRELRRLLRGYQPAGSLHGDLVILRSENHRTAGELGWRPYVDGEIHIVDLACVHSDMIQSPTNVDVAHTLRHFIDSTRATLPR